MRRFFGKGGGRAAFTLIELMVVVVVIGILIASVFRLARLAGESAKRAVTVARIERLQNALAGYYAEYGVYPPVKPVWKEIDVKGKGKEEVMYQPVRFAFPNDNHPSVNRFINDLCERYWPKMKPIPLNANDAFHGQSPPLSDVEKNGDGRVFDFGLLSFLLPRIEVAGNAASDFYVEGKQWAEQNKADPDDGDRKRECNACRRWLPHLEGCLCGAPTILGDKKLNAPKSGGYHLSGPWTRRGSGEKYVLLMITVKDGWGHELRYHSAPPHQSYRIWSAGPDGRTWENPFTPSRLDTEKKWTADDVTRFDR